jgi:hypothetical protein
MKAAWRKAAEKSGGSMAKEIMKIIMGGQASALAAKIWRNEKWRSGGVIENGEIMASDNIEIIIAKAAS